MRRITVALLSVLTLAAAAPPARAGITVYENGDKKIVIGGRIQVEYVRVDPDCPGGTCVINESLETASDPFDRLFFRRLRLYISGTVTESWMGKIEFDFGESIDADEVQVKDAYFAYSGFGNDKSKLYLGNTKTPFAREFLNSSAKLELVERGFAGDHNFGVPDRGLGLKFGSRALDGKLSYSVNLAAQYHDPGVNRMDFDTPVNNRSDWNQGWVAAGRIDFHPLGYLAFEQGDFERGKSRYTIGISVYAWENDDDNNSLTDANGVATDPTKVDLDSADGLEISGAYRGHGWSFDVAYQMVSGDTVDPNFTGGLYRNGATDLDKLSLVGGYMVIEEHFEIVGGWSSLDASNYQDEWTQASLGVNWYVKRNKLKFQLTYRQVENFVGLANQDQDVIFVNSQFVF